MLALAAMPSASVALVVARSASHGIRNGAAVAAGIVLGDLVFVWLAILGLSALAETMGAFFSALRYVGGAYLIWLGLSLFRSQLEQRFDSDCSDPSTVCMSALSGFLLTLGDVKAIFFYASLFPAFVDIQALSFADLLVITWVTVVSVGGVKLAYAFMARKILERWKPTSFPRRVRSVAGGILTGTGAYLIVKS